MLMDTSAKMIFNMNAYKTDISVNTFLWHFFLHKLSLMPVLFNVNFILKFSESESLIQLLDDEYSKYIQNCVTVLTNTFLCLESVHFN